MAVFYVNMRAEWNCKMYHFWDELHVEFYVQSLH